MKNKKPDIVVDFMNEVLFSEEQTQEEINEKNEKLSKKHDTNKKTLKIFVSAISIILLLIAFFAIISIGVNVCGVVIFVILSALSIINFAQGKKNI